MLGVFYVFYGSTYLSLCFLLLHFLSPTLQSGKNIEEMKSTEKLTYQHRIRPIGSQFECEDCKQATKDLFDLVTSPCRRLGIPTTPAPVASPPIAAVRGGASSPPLLTSSVSEGPGNLNEASMDDELAMLQAQELELAQLEGLEAEEALMLEVATLESLEEQEKILLEETKFMVNSTIPASSDVPPFPAGAVAANKWNSIFICRHQALDVY